MSDIALEARMKPRKLKDHKSRTLRLPFGKGRVGFTSDPGEAGIFENQLYATRLRAIVREPDDKIVEEHDFGSGLVTNVGVLALAYDTSFGGAGSALANLAAGKPQGKNKIAFNLFANLAFHQWGTSSTAATVNDIKLNAAAKTKSGSFGTGSAAKALKGTNTVTASGEGKPKLVSTATLEAEESLEIKEWGIFTFEELSATTGTPLTAVTATSGTVTGTPLTASSDEALGERLKIINPSETEDIWGLITSNSTSEVKVPAWYKTSSGAVKEPKNTSPYVIRPVMFDHRVFAVINVESGNRIEFPWELEIKSGG